MRRIPFVNNFEMKPTIPANEVSRHNRGEDLWIVVDGVVYDMTAFAPRHPGGFDGKVHFHWTHESPSKNKS